MSNFKLFGDAFGWIGTCLSLIFYMAPAQPYSRFIRKEISIHDVPELLLVFSYLNCITWIPYGLRDSQEKPTVCNIIGALLTLVFIIVYCAFFTNLHVKKTLLSILFLINLTIQILYISYYIIKNVKTLGLICMVFNILMYASTLEKSNRVIKTNNYHLIPILSVMLMFVNGACWFIYGLAYNDINIIIANASGVVLEGIAIGMWCYFRKKYPETRDTGDLVKSNSQSQINIPGMIVKDNNSLINAMKSANNNNCNNNNNNTNYNINTNNNIITQTTQNNLKK
jgi:solute carrier family 50 protein (sugar transporter)